MITAHTPESLRAFAEDIAAEFNAGKIRAPIHLDGGNEEQLIEVFQDIAPEDWVCGSWRMMSKCLLKGVPAEVLKAAVLDGRSITLCFPDYKIISSAIVGGILPIALGLALGIKRAGGSERVHCFLGDMTAETGMAHECVKYAANFDLPVRWIIEQNGKSVMTDTHASWGFYRMRTLAALSSKVAMYTYTLPWPHSGSGRRINF